MILSVSGLEKYNKQSIKNNKYYASETMSVILSKKLLYCYIVILLIAFCFLFLVNAVLANGILPGDATKAKTGDYTLNDFVKLFVNVAKWILGISGSLALLAFIYGGVMFLVSGGNNERVARAKQIIIGAVIGLIIVLTSFIIIGFIFTAFKIPGAKNWATSSWFNKQNPQN